MKSNLFHSVQRLIERLQTLQPDIYVSVDTMIYLDGDVISISETCLIRELVEFLLPYRHYMYTRCNITFVVNFQV